MTDKEAKLKQFRDGFDETKIIPANESLKETSVLEGYIGSGLIFIGDPGHLSGDLADKGSIAIYDPYNPFRDFDDFLDKLGDRDANLMFPDSDQHGRGVILRVNRLSGKFKVEKELDASGKVSKISIIVSD